MDFQVEVIEQSHKHPVVVDFWAPWCGPCKFLGPVIEELAEANKSKWSLVKVNTDEHQDLSNQYKIKGIPAVKMFHQGEVIAEFTGALPKNQIESWLDENLPDERKKELEVLQKKFEEGHDIVNELDQFCSDNPDLDGAKMLLAKVLIFKNPDRALQLITELSSPLKYITETEDLKSIADFMQCEGDDSGMFEKIMTARTAALSGDFDTALEELINVVMIDKSFCNEMPRRATIALFHWLGDMHELTKKYRRRLIWHFIRCLTQSRDT